MPPKPKPAPAQAPPGPFLMLEDFGRELYQAIKLRGAIAQVQRVNRLRREDGSREGVLADLIRTEQLLWQQYAAVAVALTPEQARAIRVQFRGG
ncbi:MAG: hypothetical protein ACREIK_05535 [Nitrospiraceae bacterium]